ncbi:MAG: hypothetical protein AAGE94_18235, partial [Acidobacteriota bacterium]
MPKSVVDHLSRGHGQFIFLSPDPETIRRVVPRADELLPTPTRIFLREEGADELVGFPVLASRSLRRLGSQLHEVLDAEEQAQVAAVTRAAFDSKAYAARWEAYRTSLAQVIENSVVASLGYDYGSVFWLHHSIDLARRLHEVPRRLRQQDPTTARDHGDTVTFKVYQRWLERVRQLYQQLLPRLAEEMNTDAESLLPPVFTLMAENTLILTHDYIGPDLKELNGYLRAIEEVDARALRGQLDAISAWHGQLLTRDPVVRGVAEQIYGVDPDGDPRRLLFRRGYMEFLSRHPTWDRSRLFTPDQVRSWEGLAERLKAFEILHVLRKMLVPVQREEGRFVCRDRSINTTWVGGPPVLELAAGTRPMDFTHPWVVDPTVQRFGLVYDITDFSATISLLGKVEKTAIDKAFRMTARFQRRIDADATALGLRLEKYLGDGAFYSGRSARQLLVLAIRIQRLYPQFVRDGFPFDKGLRIALNFGEYRLLPLQGEPGLLEPRYEYFGHGLVELSRLTTGKKTQEIEAFKTFLLSQGYPDSAVAKFFAPMMRRDADLVSKVDESRDFYAYINPNQALINEGIVVTEPFVRRLGSFDQMIYAKQHGGGYVGIAVPLPDGSEEWIGFRKLGRARFKGLDPLPIYEMVDGGDWDPAHTKPIPTQPLFDALERLF